MNKSEAINFAVLQSCNVSYAKKIDLDTLLGILENGEDCSAWLSHLDTFFDELPEVYLERFIKLHRISYANMVNTLNRLPAPYRQPKVYDKIKSLYTTV